MLSFLPNASAKVVNFNTSSPVGFGIRGGIAQNQEQSFTPSPQTVKSSYTKFIGINPFFDFGNFILRADFDLHYHPLVVSSGTDPANAQSFNESSDAKTFNYGGSLLFIPFVSKSLRQRIYLGFGLGMAKLYDTNTRNYTNAAGQTTNTYTEKVSDTATYLDAIAGYEFFLVQNYSLGVETGYRSLQFASPAYSGNTTKNVRGTTVAGGNPVKTANGTDEVFTYSGLYFSLNFNLHF